LKKLIPLTLLALLWTGCAFADGPSAPAPTPKAPFTDYRYEKPGTVRKITPQDLPAPYATKSATNGPRVVDRPKNVWPQAPAGFKVELYTTDVQEPRLILAAPNGDFFVAETHNGDIKVFRGITADGRPQQTATFATGLTEPYAIAFYPPGPNPQYVYIGDTDAVLRFPYHNVDLKATGKPQHLASLPSGGAHSTRDLVFSPDGRRLFVAVGSDSKVNDPDTHPDEKNRADILVMNPDGW
jgi:glucose/arabinose dehydrogenase